MRRTARTIRPHVDRATATDRGRWRSTVCCGTAMSALMRRSTVDHLLMNRPRDPGVIWSKSTQAAVGVLVGCIAAAGIQLVAKPAAPEQAVEAPKVSVVMVAEMDPGPSATLEATASPSPTGTPLAS